jgi:LPXTG-motif cell wall-anchored protein
MRSNIARRLALGCALAVIPLFIAATPASAAQVSLTIDHFYLFDPYPLVADDAGTVDQLKSDISTQSPNDFFTDICVVHNGVAMQPGHTLTEYGVQSGDTVNVYGLPMSKLGHWSITPDEPALGNTIGMTPISHPAPTHVELIDGALPVGASLDENTGTISGKFEQPGPFSATFRATTICGDWDINWSGDVYSRLPNTGIDAGATAAAGTLGLLSFLTGTWFVMARRRRRISED